MSSLREICHLWRRAGFGATPEDLRRGLRQGYRRTVHELVYYDEVPDNLPHPPFTTVLPPGIRLNFVEIGALMQWWLEAMVHSRRPLQEKLTLFWHGHFTTSADPVFSAGLLLRQNQTLRELASGRFGDLLSAVARDPAMLIYLDGVRNHKAHPNENFAREVMELFTLGIGHYSEKDVREAARAFTGWSLAFPSGSFLYRAADHDDGVKRFLGHVGTFDGDDVLRILTEHPQTARHVSGRLFRFFVDREPAAAEADWLADTYRRHHGHVRPLVEAILLSDGFRAAAYQANAFKSPIEYVVSAIRSLGGDFRWQLLNATRLMGQLPFLPPSVKGWVQGPAWINASTLLDRVNFAHTLTRQMGHAAYAPLPLQELLESCNGAEASRRLLRAMGMADCAADTRRILASAWESMRTQAEAGKKLVELALASPDFQRR